MVRKKIGTDVEQWCASHRNTTIIWVVLQRPREENKEVQSDDRKWSACWANTGSTVRASSEEFATSSVVVWLEWPPWRQQQHSRALTDVRPRDPHPGVSCTAASTAWSSEILCGFSELPHRPTSRCVEVLEKVLPVPTVLCVQADDEAPDFAWDGSRPQDSTVLDTPLRPKLLEVVQQQKSVSN
jgi:hypothetical protein